MSKHSVLVTIIVLTVALGGVCLHTLPASANPGADLIIESVTLTPPNPAPGEEFDVAVVIRNQGDADVTTSFWTHLYLDPTDQPPTTNTAHSARTSIFGLNAGAEYTWERLGETFDTAGPHHIYAWVDRDNEVSEDNDDNNLYPPSSEEGDEYEDDDSCAEATVIIPTGVTQTHNLAPLGDVDWLKFDAVSGATYIVVVKNIGSDADVVISLHNRCEGPPGFGSGQRIEWRCPAEGTYYIKVEHQRADYDPAESTYEIAVYSDDACAGDMYEEDDSCGAARDISLDGAAQRRLFCKQGDTDWIKFQATAGQNYVIESTNIGADTEAVLSLVNSCGTPPGFGGGQRIAWECPTSGVYYIKAENDDPDAHGASEAYDLSVTVEGGSAEDSYEPNDTANEAGEIGVGDTAQTHNIYPAADVDWVKFTATSGTRYTLETLNLGADADTFIALYNTDKETRLAWDDDSGEGKGSRIIWNCAVNGTYYLKINHHDPNAAGAGTQYDLRVRVSPCDADAYEDDDSSDAARPISTDGSVQTHNFCPTSDEDWVQFTAGAGQNYIIETSELGVDSDTVLYLYDRDGSTELAQNDDYGSGQASRLSYQFTSAGTYYVKVRHYNPSKQGAGTEYQLSVHAGAPPTPPPTTTPPPTPSPTPTPPPSQIKTLILVNRERIEHYYAGQSAGLMSKLEELANHAKVNGVIVQVENNAAVAQAYTTWNADTLNTAKANAVAGAVRNLVMSYLNSNDSIEHVVLVGDDRIIPHRRVPDLTSYPEHNYTAASRDTTVGAACGDDMNLTDDYFVDRAPYEWEGHEVYMPDLPIGRLIESPTEIAAYIDEFIARGGEVTANRALVTGYDFVQDAAQEICSFLRQDLGAGNINCDLIGESWTGAQMQEAQFATAPRYDIHSINGHANHSTQGAPGAGSVTANDVDNATNDLGGALIFTVGCHSGTNVPENNATSPLDLAQAYLRRKANYVANTGYGWGIRGAVGLSERLMRDYAQFVLQGGAQEIGAALVQAKQHYYQNTDTFSGYDEKILIESTLYGLPMYEFSTGAVLGDDDPFADVTFTATVPAAFGDLTVGDGGFSLNDSFVVLDEVVTEDGSVYVLNGFISTNAGTPQQPLFFRALEPQEDQPVRGVMLTGATYQDVAGTFDPIISSAENEHISGAEPAFEHGGWYPAAPFSLAPPVGNMTDGLLNFSLGQYNAISQTERLYDAATFDIYYSNSPDYLAPSVTLADGYIDRADNHIHVKVAVSDTSDIARVNVAYTSGDGAWQHQDLTYDTTMRKWTGHFAGSKATVAFIQVADGAGNVTIDANKGYYYTFDYANVTPAGEQYQIFLPVVLKSYP